MKPSSMKALSIRQPWAWLIVNGHKSYENRDWALHNPCKKYRGPFLVHASKTMTRDEYAFGVAVAEDYGIPLPAMKDLERGGIIGQAEVVAWHDCPPDIPFAFSDGLELRNARTLPFQPCSGSLGFFEPKI